MNTELKITKGEWVNYGISSDESELYASGNPLFDIIPYVNLEEHIANTELIVDAGNAIQSCGLLPSELLKQNQEMRDMLKKISVVLEEIWVAEDGDNIIFDKINAEELEKLIESTNP